MNLGEWLKKPFGVLLVLTLYSVPVSFAADMGYGPVTKPISPLATVCSAENKWVSEFDTLISQTKQNQPELANALRLFPKGADIHNHLSGAIQPEDYIAMGINDGDCYGPATPPFSIVRPNPDGTCNSGYTPLSKADQTARTAIMQSLSMYQYGYPNIQGGHDQFFATFGRFGAVSGMAGNTAPMLAKLLQQANGDSVSYVETMLSFQTTAVGNLADQLRLKFPDDSAYKDTTKYPAMLDTLVDSGLKNVVSAASQDVARYVAATSAVMKCDEAGRDPACDVTYAFQAAVNRNAKKTDGSPDLAMIFTQTAFSVFLAAYDGRVVGVNLLSGEDADVSMGSFTTQMQFFAYLHGVFPEVNIALHAGELTPCFIGPDNPALKGHLTGSLIAGAKRIGHGVSFSYLNDSDKKEVAGLMAKNNALVEIMFTSNAQILGVAGKEHPFEQYASYKVPMAFSTDDEGVSYADYSDEWIYGFMEYHLSGDDLVTLGRNSLQYSFIPGAPLWRDVRGSVLAGQCVGQTPGIPNPSDTCKAFLTSSTKAKTQWDYEARLVRYLRNYGKYLQKNIPAVEKAPAPVSPE